MPICTSCTHHTQYLYTVYDSADNLRLEQCVSHPYNCRVSRSLTDHLKIAQSACHAFADPYVEHDTLTLWIDLILLKRDVYRHLLFNRGTGARRLGTSATKVHDDGGQAITSDTTPQSRERVHIIRFCAVQTLTGLYRSGGCIF